METKTPKCCKKPMELKAVTEGRRSTYYYFQCKKCGRVKSETRSYF